MTARSAILPGIDRIKYASRGLHEPWVNDCAIAPMLKEACRVPRQITQADVDRWIKELRAASYEAYKDEIDRLEADACDHLLRIARSRLNAKGPCLRMVHCGAHGKALMCTEADGFASSRLLLGWPLFTEAVELLCPNLNNVHELFAVIPCRDMLGIYATEAQARKVLDAPVWQNPLAVQGPISMDVFVLSADGVAGTRKETVEC
jgi:hypothetical protein